jgi:cyanophycin synthetase
MRIRETQIFRGANYWANVPVIRLSLEIGEFEVRSTSCIPGFYEKLTTTLPSAHAHQCSDGRRASFFEHVHEGTTLSHVAQHMALELQNLAGQQMGNSPRCLPIETGAETCHVIFRYEQQDVAVAAGQLAIRLLDFFIEPDEGREFDFSRELKEFSRLAVSLSYGPSTRALVAEARRRNIPVQRLDDSRERVQLGRGTRALRSLLQLGYGKHQRHIWAPYISIESHLAADIALNKDLTYRLLRNAGIPVPRSIKVRDEEAALAAAVEIGHPVVVKPLDGNHGRGVGINLQDETAVRQHYPRAAAETNTGTVLVEKFIPGNTYRVLVVGGRAVAVTEEVPAHVVGDGTHTLRQLVGMTNADPRRGHGSENLLVRIRLDDTAIALAQEQGYGPNDVPQAGRKVQLVKTAHISLGGISIDRTDEIHPYNAMIAEQAAQVIGLQVAGIDLLARDISQSVQETGGAICEVNAGPGLGLHLEPVQGKPRDVARPVIELLFPPSASSRVPIVAVTGAAGKTTVSRIIAHILKAAGCKVAMANADGMYLDGIRVAQSDCSGSEAARIVLRNPTVETAVLEIGYEGILCSGLGYDRADVVVITQVSNHPRGSQYVEPSSDLVRLNAVVAKSASPDGQLVLNADDEACVMIGSKAGVRVVYFTMNPGNPVVARHVRAGGEAILLRHDSNASGFFLVGRGGATLLLGWAPATPEEADVNDTSVVGAVAACTALSISGEHINGGLRSLTMLHKEHNLSAFAALRLCS